MSYLRLSCVGQHGETPLQKSAYTFRSYANFICSYVLEKGLESRRTSLSKVAENFSQINITVVIKIRNQFSKIYLPRT